MNTSQSRSPRRSQAEWQHILERFEASGMTQAAFCREQGLSVSTFGYWKRRLGEHRQAGGPDGDASAGVIDLGALTERPAGWSVEIQLGDGVSVTLRRG